MTALYVYNQLKKVTDGIWAYDEQMVAIANWVKTNFEEIEKEAYNRAIDDAIGIAVENVGRMTIELQRLKK